MPKRDADVELKQEQRRIYRGSAAAFVTCGVVLGASHVFLPRFIQFPGDDLQSKLTFWASANMFIVIWIMIGIGMVSRGRRHSAKIFADQPIPLRARKLLCRSPSFRTRWRGQDKSSSKSCVKLERTENVMPLAGIGQGCAEI